MKPSLAFGLFLVWWAGYLQPAHASDWAESSEVRSRLDQLKGRPIQRSPLPFVDDMPDQLKGSPQKTVAPWKNISYDTIGPTEAPQKAGRSQGRSIEVAEVDKLGYQLNNTEMRNKVLNLYRRPDIVVEQYVIGQ